MSTMELSPRGLDWLKQVEGLRLQPYDDQDGKPISRWVIGATVGYGHLIPKQEWDALRNGVTLEEAQTLLQQDLKPFERAVSAAVQPPQQPHQFDALVILCYNIGAGAFSKSSVVRHINDPSTRKPYPTLHEAWMAWNKSQGKVMKGLVRRREGEWRIYSAANYQPM